MKLRFIFDTNVYSKVFEEKNVLSFIDFIEKNKSEFIVYGCRIIRKELRGIGKSTIIEGLKLRNSTLTLYDSIVDGHNLEVTFLAEQLAKKYYDELNGVKPFKKLENDLTIVALASLSNLDLIVSEDNKTLASKNFVKVYSKVNEENSISVPEIISLKKFYQLF
ncbi:MAG TPA: hypothetical protein VJK05_06025 [archaeon]|nr:hypothetical protein [archaeon]